jgi:hypothetical protein
MKPVRIKSDGTSHGTKIFVDGVQLKNVKSLRLEGDAEEGFLLHLTLYSLPRSIDVEVDGPMEVTEQREALGAGTEAP